MKPKSIQLFDRFFLGAMALGIINYVVRWNETVEALAKVPDAANLGFGPGYAIFIFTSSMLINLAVWFFISHRASKVAKWIQTLLYVLGILSLIANFNNPLSPRGLALAGIVIISILYGYATYLLFRADSLAWFDGRNVDRDIFS